MPTVGEILDKFFIKLKIFRDDTANTFLLNFYFSGRGFCIATTI